MIVILSLLFLIPWVSAFPECKKSTFGSDYRGRVNVTNSGLTCQSWSSQFPHSHVYYSPALFPDNSMEEMGNYCRNPDDEYSGPWCYTTDPDVRWQSCDIPDCWPYAQCKMTTGGAEYRGSISVTSSGNSCKTWNELNPIETKVLDLKRIPEDPHQNFCRNPDGKDGPWCFIEGLEGAWEYCDVPYCKPSANCKITESGYNYIGTASDTIDDIACQRWDEQAPHIHPFNDPSAFPDASVSDAVNYCRNPDNRPGGPWCYTLNPEVESQFCDVPTCSDCKSSESGREYAGSLSTTIGGFTCQAWDTQSPHEHPYTDLNRFPDSSLAIASNFCRNPTGSDHPDGPWCFTTDPEVEWDYCNILPCDESNKPNVPVANHVLFIGVDGLKPSCIPDAPGGAPNLYRLAAEGTSTLTMARTCLRTWSAPGWSTSLCGMDNIQTGVTGNSWVPTWLGSDQDLSPVTGRNTMIPCVFHQLKSTDANIRTAAFYDWNWFRFMTNKGFPGYVDYESSYDENYIEDDESIKEEAVKYLRENLVSAEKSFTFVYLGAVDDTGHSYRWCEEEYMDQLDKADVRIGEILDVLDELNMSDEVLVILSADHGGEGFGHGRYADSDVLVPMYVRGPGVKKNAEFTRIVETQDIVPTAFHALGLKPSSWWSGNVMFEAFEED